MKRCGNEEIMDSVRKAEDCQVAGGRGSTVNWSHGILFVSMGNAHSQLTHQSSSSLPGPVHWKEGAYSSRKGTLGRADLQDKMLELKGRMHITSILHQSSRARGKANMGSWDSNSPLLCPVPKAGLAELSSGHPWKLPSPSN